MTNVDALKKLAVKLGCAESVSKVDGTTTAEVIAFIEKKYTAPVVPAIPTVPTEAGDYKLVIGSDGKASWAKITG